MTTSTTPPRGVLASAIAAYRDGLQAMVLRTLTAAHGDAFADAVTAALSPQRRAALRLKVRLGRLDDGALRPDEFGPIIEHDWELFGPELGGDRDLVRRMDLVAEWWREVGGPGGSAIAASEVRARLTEIADLLERAGEPARAV